MTDSDCNEFTKFFFNTLFTEFSLELPLSSVLLNFILLEQKIKINECASLVRRDIWNA